MPKKKRKNKTLTFFKQKQHFIFIGIILLAFSGFLIFAVGAFVRHKKSTSIQTHNIPQAAIHIANTDILLIQDDTKKLKNSYNGSTPKKLIPLDTKAESSTVKGYSEQLKENYTKEFQLGYVVKIDEGKEYKLNNTTATSEQLRDLENNAKTANNNNDDDNYKNFIEHLKYQSFQNLKNQKVATSDADSKQIEFFKRYNKLKVNYQILLLRNDYIDPLDIYNVSAEDQAKLYNNLVLCDTRQGCTLEFKTSSNSDSQPNHFFPMEITYKEINKESINTFFNTPNNIDSLKEVNNGIIAADKPFGILKDSQKYINSSSLTPNYPALMPSNGTPNNIAMLFALQQATDIDGSIFDSLISNTNLQNVNQEAKLLKTPFQNKPRITDYKYTDFNSDGETKIKTIIYFDLVDNEGHEPPNAFTRQLTQNYKKGQLIQSNSELQQQKPKITISVKTTSTQGNSNKRSN